MQKFIEAHKDNIHGSISCVDRIIFKGYSFLSWAENMEKYLSHNGVLLKDFKNFALRLSGTIKSHGLETALQSGRPYLKPCGKLDKEDKARDIAQKDNITEGLICVISAMESSPTFKMIPSKDRPKLINTSIPQLCLYYYFMDKEFGMMHIRIQTWLPFTVQIYINGHEWLARQMTKADMQYLQQDNCFVEIKDMKGAQDLADKFQRIDWISLLSSWARQVNPLPDKQFPQSYYWSLDQVEYSTDIIFKNSTVLNVLYKKLLERSILRFGPKDVLTFLGKKFDGRFTGDQINSMKVRFEGARVKHWMNKNWIKMYNKFGNVLRIETVINDPYSFRILRRGIRNGKEIFGWFPMAKGVSNLYRYAEIGLSANSHYLDALAVESDPRPAKESLRQISSPVVANGRRFGAFNPVNETSISIFKAVMNGDYAAFGFQNRNIRNALFAGERTQLERQSAKTSRLLKKLQAHGFISKVQRSRRWRVTDNGWRTMTAAVEIYERGWQQTIDKQAS